MIDDLNLLSLFSANFFSNSIHEKMIFFPFQIYCLCHHSGKQLPGRLRLRTWFHHCAQSLIITTTTIPWGGTPRGPPPGTDNLRPVPSFSVIACCQRDQTDGLINLTDSGRRRGECSSHAFLDPHHHFLHCLSVCFALPVIEWSGSWSRSQLFPLPSTIVIISAQLNRQQQQNTTTLMLF